MSLDELAPLLEAFRLPSQKTLPATFPRNRRPFLRL